jgi:PD-(D/E)XK nuclease superfamily protein
MRRSYTDEIDLFAVYCPDTERVYVIPVDEATESVGSLRVLPPANGQARRIRWAADYELPG